jgi:hypothetical protein
MFHQPPQAVTLPPVVLWKSEALTCTCVTYAADRVEVRLIVAGVLIERASFSDIESASQFALDKMHAYNAG